MTLRRRTYDEPGWRVATAQERPVPSRPVPLGRVLLALLPNPKPAVSQVAVAFFVTQLIGAASQFPGGLDAFETVVPSQLDHVVPTDTLMLSSAPFAGSTA